MLGRSRSPLDLGVPPIGLRRDLSLNKYAEDRDIGAEMEEALKIPVK